MTCQEAIAKLAEYLDAELTADTLRQVEAHLGVCELCRAYLATYRRTKELAAKMNRIEMPPSLKARLSALLSDLPPRSS